MTTPVAPAAPSAPAAAPAAPEKPAAGGNLAANAPKAPAAPGNAPQGAKDTAPKADLAPKAPTTEAPSKRKYKLNIDGQTQEAEYTDDQIAVELQKSRAAAKRFEEAAKIQKAYQQLREEGKKDPRILLKELAGLEDVDAWAEGLVAEKWKRQTMTPEQVAQQEQQTQLEQYRAKVEAYEKAQQETFQKQQQAQLEQQIETDVKAAFEISGFEFNAENLESFVKVMADALEYGVELTPAQVVAQVKAQHEERDRSYTDKTKSKILSLKGDALLNELGDDVVKEILRASIAKHDSAQAAVFETPGVTQPEKTQERRELPKSATSAWRRLGRY